MEDGREGSSPLASHLLDTNTAAEQRRTASAATVAALVNGLDDHTLTSNHGSDSDSDSDASSVMMDVSDSDDDLDPKPEPANPPPPGSEPHANAGVKRKMSDDVITNGSSSSVREQAKKPKLSQTPSPQAAAASPPESLSKTYLDKPSVDQRLPPNLWQRAFLNLSPADLYRSMRVCKTFNSLLTNTKADPQEGRDDKKDNNHGNIHPGSVKRIRVVDSNTIWAIARRVWIPNMPKPLAGFTELQMLQLVGGRSCQLCHNPAVVFVDTSAPLKAGPGVGGVRVIWPFGIRACGPCLRDNSVTDIALLKTPDAILAPGLPHIIMTNDLHFIPEFHRQTVAAIPKTLRPAIPKVYYRRDVELIVAEYEHAKDLGAHEEWRKGLYAKGKVAMADAARWEKWEAQVCQQGIGLASALREHDPSSSANHLAEAKGRSTADENESPAHIKGGKSEYLRCKSSSPPHSYFRSAAKSHEYAVNSEASAIPSHPALRTPCPNPYFTGEDSTDALPSTQWQPQPVWPAQTAPPHQQGPSQDASMPGAMQPWPAQHPPQQVKWTPDQVVQGRQARKEEIERRCLQLDPPLEAKVLPFMESFQAAIQIHWPLTDQAWEVLKPRILAQREAAELAQHQQEHQLALFKATMPAPNDKDYFHKPAKEIYDKDYELTQAPLRSKLEQYVDDYIRNFHEGQTPVDRDATPVFAASAILHVYNRYKQDKAAGAIPKPAVVANPKRRAQTPPQELVLSLDNMKWLFENKIKSYLDPICREMFVCAGCHEEDPQNVKWFAFEGLIQHFAAKHTNAFSKGNIIVHWQTSFWPEESPFHPKPETFMRSTIRKSHSHKVRANARNTPQPRHDGVFSTPGSGNAFHSNNRGAYSNGYYGGAQGYSHNPYDQSNHQAAPYDQRQGYSQAQWQRNDEPRVVDNDMLHKYAADAREAWDALEGVSERELLNCVRVNAVMHHANSLFLDKFKFVPALDDVIEALATEPILQPIKTAGGLACKQCVASQSDGSADYNSYYPRVKNAKLFTFNSIIVHYRIKHQQHMDRTPWTKAMIEQPEVQLIKDVARAEGMDEQKLRLIVTAFPYAFAGPQIWNDDVPDHMMDPGASTGVGVTSKPAGHSAKKGKGQAQSKKKGKRRGSSGTPPKPQEHEYDPREPMATAEQDEEDIAARFDTDIARKKASANAAPTTATALALAPETLRALQAFASSQASAPTQVAQQAPINNAALERAPSVGRGDSPAASAPAPQALSSTNGTPDIAAILAELQRTMTQPPQAPQQVATPTVQASRDAPAPHSVGRDPGVDELYRSLSTSYSHDRPSTISAYAPHQPHPLPKQPMQYTPSAEPSTSSPRYEAPGQDLQAALERNMRHFSQNQAQPTQLPQYSPPPAYAQASPDQHVAPPRVKYEYDDGYGYAHAQGQGQPAPVQYLQRPQHGSPSYAPGYPPQHQRPQLQAQRVVYVDEHGRELIRVDAAANALQHARPPQSQQPYGGHTGYGGGGDVQVYYATDTQGRLYYDGSGQYGGGR